MLLGVFRTNTTPLKEISAITILLRILGILLNDPHRVGSLGNIPNKFHDTTYNEKTY